MIDDDKVDKISLTLACIGVFIFSIILFNSVSAATQVYDYEIEQGKSYDIKRPCFNNGTFCSGSAACNITITDSSGQAIIKNQRMTNQISFHNYTLSAASTQQLGAFNAIMTCSDGGLNGDDTFTLYSAPLGSTETLGFFIVVILLLYGITLVGAYFESYPIATIGGLGLLGLGVFIMTEGIDIYRNFATTIVAFITIAIGAYFGLTGAMKIIQENM